MGATMAEGDVENFTIKSSHEFGGTLIEEEIVVAETREDVEMGDILSISSVGLETHIPCKKRRGSK